MNFLVFSDSIDISKQILSFLNGKGSTTIVTTVKDESIKNYGASKVIFLKGKANFEGISAILEQQFKNNFDYLLVSSTSLGRDVASFISVKLNATVIPEVFSIDFTPSGIRTKRFGLGGKVVIEEESNARVLTVLPGISEEKPSGSTSSSEEMEISEGKVKIISIQQKKAKEVDLEKANIIVSVGRGLGKKEGLQQIEPFAKKIGAEIAGSRPVCLDYQWLSEDRQVGYSGRKVRPKIYIALGISGQIQHIAGMRDSKIVISVNKDKNAPIFQESDYGIVGDLYAAVQKIMSYL
ncbi:MAG: electron transfer flavoprotein subunit alpha/FixB family protein [Thermoplasmatales archaeon]